MSNNQNLEVQKLNLKIQALGESFSNKAVGYENQIADLRVELTLLSNELEELRAASNVPAEEQE